MTKRIEKYPENILIEQLEKKHGDATQLINNCMESVRIHERERILAIIEGEIIFERAVRDSQTDKSFRFAHENKVSALSRLKRTIQS